MPRFSGKVSYRYSKRKKKFSAKNPVFQLPQSMPNIWSLLENYLSWAKSLAKTIPAIPSLRIFLVCWGKANFSIGCPIFQTSWFSIFTKIHMFSSKRIAFSFHLNCVLTYLKVCSTFGTYWQLLKYPNNDIKRVHS